MHLFNNTGKEDRMIPVRLIPTIALAMAVVLLMCLVSGCSNPTEELSNDVRSGQIQINGIIYQLPVSSVKEFKKWLGV